MAHKRAAGIVAAPVSNLAGHAEFHELSGYGVLHAASAVPNRSDAARTKWSALGFVKTFLAAALAASVPLSPALARQLHVVVLGDNNIRGKGVALHDAYPAQLERALRARGVDVTVANAGRDSDTTTGVMARLDTSVPTRTDVAIISVGVNDVVIHGVAPEASKANVREIARRLRARGVEVVLLRTGGKFQGALAGRPEYHVEKGFGPRPGTTEWHLNAQGYATVAARTLPLVLAAIERVRDRRGE